MPSLAQMVDGHAKENFLAGANGYRLGEFFHVAPWYFIAFCFCTL
jgi:hypothetical protein